MERVQLEWKELNGRCTAVVRTDVDVSLLFEMVGDISDAVSSATGAPRSSTTAPRAKIQKRDKQEVLSMCCSGGWRGDVRPTDRVSVIADVLPL